MPPAIVVQLLALNSVWSDIRLDNTYCLPDKTVAELMQVAGLERSHQVLGTKPSSFKSLMETGWLEMTIRCQPHSCKQKCGVTTKGQRERDLNTPRYTTDYLQWRLGWQSV